MGKAIVHVYAIEIARISCYGVVFNFLRVHFACYHEGRGDVRHYPLEPSRSPPWMKKTSPANASLR